MPIRNTPTQWGSVTKSLHWLMALLILVLMILGWTAVNWPLSPTKIDLFVWHKSLGILALVLVLARILWRLGNPRPVPDLPAGEQRMASLAHVLLYGLMIAMPLSGWVIHSAADIFPLKLLGLVTLPAIVEPDKNLRHIAETVHLTLFWLLAGLLILHIGAALRHHFIKQNDVLRKMLPALPGARKTSPGDSA